MDIAPVGFTGGGLFHSQIYSAQPFYNKGRTTHFFFRLSRKNIGEGDSQKEEVFPDHYNLIIIVNYLS